MTYSHPLHNVNYFRGMAYKRFLTVCGLGMTRLIAFSCWFACMQLVANAQQANVNPGPETGSKAEREAPQVDREAEVEASSRAGKLILVIGAPGTEEFGDAFETWGQRWRKVADQSDLEFLPIGLDDKPKQGSDRDLLRKTLTSEVGNQSTPLWLVLIGHGTYARDIAKFNMRGPDVSGADLAKWMNGTSRPIVIINCASASGPFVNRLSGPRRVVVTATRSGIEQN